MTKQLAIDEMLECLLAMKHPSAAALQITLEGLGSAMAQLIAKELDVHAGPATFQGVAFAGTCAPFTPHFAGQPCPKALEPYDTLEWEDGE
jgi:hypothetical protein